MNKIKGFERLNEDEQQFLLEVPVIITFLIAGSDNNIDEKERDWAERLIEFRSMKNESELVEYYNWVERSWEDSFTKYSKSANKFANQEPRNNFLAAELERCNAIFPKLDKRQAQMLYKSFISFAKQVAMASGGILGIGAISADENKWVNLKMIKEPAE